MGAAIDCSGRTSARKWKRRGSLLLGLLGFGLAPFGWSASNRSEDGPPSPPLPAALSSRLATDGLPLARASLPTEPPGRSSDEPARSLPNKFGGRPLTLPPLAEETNGDEAKLSGVEAGAPKLRSADGPAASTPLPARPTPIPPTNLPTAQPAPVPFNQPGKVAPMPPPAAPGGAPLPVPREFPPADDRIRLPRLAGPLGSTPVPTAKDLEEYKQFVEGVVDPRNTLDLIEGRSRLLLMKVTPTQTQVADPEVLSLGALGPNQVSLIGRRPGSTVLTLFFSDPEAKGKERVLSYLVRVLPDPEAKDRLEQVYRVLEKEINCAFPNSRVCLSLVGDKLMVSGQAHDIHDATQIMRIARANAPGAAQDPGSGATGAVGGGQAGRVPVTNINPVGVPGDPTNPTGTPGLASFQTAGGPNVINNLRVPGEQQVSLKVTVAEVNRAAARSIGVNYSVINNRGVPVFSQLTGSLGSSLNGNGVGFGGLLGAAGSATGTTGLTGSPGLGGVSGATGVNLPINIDSGQLPILLNALRNLNYARSLAEPNLTAMNGQTATFLAGGQFPVPVLGGLGGFNAGGAGGLAGLQGVQFVPFGVQLSFTPIITDRDRVRLSVSATVSTRDLNTGAQVGGTNVPGLSARTFTTTVELREGQTLAVAGLIQNNLAADSARVPFFGDLPLVGHLSGVSRVQHGEQELVILITPELVYPLDPHERPPLPGSDVFEPGDVEFYVLGRLESRRTYDYRSPVRTDVHRMLNYRRCEEKYIFGPTGYSPPGK